MPAARKRSPAKASLPPAVKVETFTTITFNESGHSGEDYKALVGPQIVSLPTTDGYGEATTHDVPAGEVLILAPCGEERSFYAADLQALCEAIAAQIKGQTGK